MLMPLRHDDAARDYAMLARRREYWLRGTSHDNNVASRSLMLPMFRASVADYADTLRLMMPMPLAALIFSPLMPPCATPPRLLLSATPLSAID